MRFVVLVKANKDTEAGLLPTEKALTEMGAFNETLVDSGMILSGEGLQASSKGARIQFEGTKAIVTHGPFLGAKDLVAGFWMIQAKSMEEAIAVFSRCPPSVGELEIRRVMEAEDFGAEFTPELREREERLRARAANRS